MYFREDDQIVEGYDGLSYNSKKFPLWLIVLVILIIVIILYLVLKKKKKH